jgi:predicted porin
MKKTLIALAALAAAGATLAQSSVTVYGRLDLGMSQQTTTEGTAAGVDALSLAGAQDMRTGSRLGFRGTEDLGGGLRAGFNYEISINADRVRDGNAQTRLANLSLSGGFGTVVIGTFMNAFDTARGFSPDTQNVPGGDFALFGLNRTVDATASVSQFDGRTQNAIAYVSPAFNGFTASFGLVREDNTLVTGVDANGFIIGLGYSQGPLRAQFAFGDMNADTTAGVNVVDLRNWALGASYNFGPAVLSFVYEDTRNSRNTGTAITDANSWEIGASFPMGAFAPYVTFGQGELVTGVGAGRVVNDTDSWQIGTTYNLSARTWIYAAIGEEQRETTGGVNVRKEAGYAIGLVHTF